MTVASWLSSACFWEGYVLPYNPFTTKVSCWLMFSVFSISIFRYFSAELLPPSCSDEQCYSVTSARTWIYLHWTSWSLCQPSLQPEQRLCSPKHQLLFPQVHVICRHSEGATPLHPGCIIHPCATALLFCNTIWMNLFFTISCWNSSRECCSVHLTLQ